MIANKHITKIVAVMMAVLVGLCVCAVGFSDQLVSAAGGLGVTMEYESKLFDTTEVLEINILMDDGEWQSMLDNAMSEEYVQCDVEVAGKTFYRVGIRPKGNTSLSTIVTDSTTDRYSLKLEFDQYVDGQTCFGLDKLILNNNYADATNMKEALIYDMFAYVGADASLYNYAKVSVNGEYWGAYLALEAVEDSFMLRNYGTDDGELYKPDSMEMGGGDGQGNMPDMGSFNRGSMDFGDMQPSENSGDAAPETAQTPDSGSQTTTPDEQMTVPGGQTAAPDGQTARADGEMPSGFEFPDGGEMPDMGDFDFSEMMGGGMFGNGTNLNYSDEELDSYSAIWDGEVTNTGDSDHKRVVTALKNISEGTNLEEYMDIDNLLRYATVHIFSVNEDSLSGSMSHNYYLYESDGRLNLLPWDYNLAFGGMGGMGMGGSNNDNATSTVNSAIDDAWSSTEFFDALMENQEYHAAYYTYMQRVVDYIQNGGFDEFYNRTRNLIDTLVETDPNAFYEYEEYLTAVETLYEVVTLRGRSIQGQIDGTIPSTESEQKNSDALIDASHIDLSVMGSMNTGGSGGRGGNFDFNGMNFENFDPREGNRSEGLSTEANSVSAANDSIYAVTLLTTGTGQDSSSSSEDDEASINPFGGSQGGFNGQMPEDMDPSQFGGEMPEGMDPSKFGGQMPGGTEQPENSEDVTTPEQSPGSDENSGTSEEEPGGKNNQRPSMENMPDMNEMFGFNAGQIGNSTGSTLITYGIAAVVMLAAFLFALFYRRRPRKR